MAEAVRFEDRVVIVTGAARGLGRAYARLFAARGASVVVNDVGVAADGRGESASPAESVVAEIEAAGGVAVADAHDVSTEESAAAIVATALDVFGRLDAVVNNAGIQRDGPFATMSADDFTAVLAVHVFGTFHVTRAAWPHFVAGGGGRVVTTTSPAGYLGNAGQVNYGTAKAGIIGLTRTLAKEGVVHGIRVNAIAPAGFTRMFEGHVDRMPEETAAVVRGLDVDLVAPVVAVLAHDACPVNGEVVLAAGGRIARVFTAQTRGVYRPGLTPESVLAELPSLLADASDPLVLDQPGEQFAVLRDLMNG